MFHLAVDSVSELAVDSTSEQENDSFKINFPKCACTDESKIAVD